MLGIQAKRIDVKIQISFTFFLLDPTALKSTMNKKSVKFDEKSFLYFVNNIIIFNIYIEKINDKVIESKMNNLVVLKNIENLNKLKSR